MKNYIKTILIIFILKNVYSQNCQNNTSTDILYPSPNNNSFKKNTFDWTSRSTFPNNTIPYAIWSSGWKIDSITNPFWSPSPHMHLIAAGLNSDNKPEDGWELIKQDFGYFYSNNYWKGGIMGHGLPGDPRGYPSTVMYFILYNKYTSTMRILFRLLADNADILTDKILVKIQLIHNDNNPNYSNMVLNGLFNSYNGIQYALDKKTIVSEIIIPTTIINANLPGFSYCDIDISYDPCICFFESGMKISFHEISTGNINLTGQLAGVSGIPILDIANNYIHGMSLNSDNFVTSIFNNSNNLPETVMQHYLNFLAYQNDVNNSNGTDNEFSDLQLFLNYTSQLMQVLGSVGSIVDPQTSEIMSTAAQYIGKGADFLNYFNSKVDKNNSANNPYSHVNLITARLNLQGTLTYNFEIPGQNIFITTPGSLNANNAPEYDNANFGTVPSYPMYNEVLGLFTLLKTPKVECYKDINFFDIYNPNPNAQSNITTFSYRSIGNLEYALNPIVNKNKSKIYVRYEIDGMPIEPTVLGPSYIVYENQVIDGGWNSYYNDYGEVSSQCFSPSHTGLVRYKYNRIVTPYYPVSCFSNIYLRERYTVKQHDNPDCFFNPLFSNRNVILCVLLDLYFNPDNYGQEHHVIKIQKFKCDVTNTNTDFNQYDPNSTLNYVTAPYDKVITNTNYPIGNQEVYAYNNIKIKGNQVGNNSFVYIHSGNEISIEDESDISGNNEFDIYIKPISNFFNTCDIPVSQSAFNDTYMEDYCKNQNLYAGNQGYQANQSSGNRTSNTGQTYNKNNYSSLDNKVNKQIKNNISDINVILFPNPSNKTITVFCSDKNTTIHHITIKDISGKIVLQQQPAPANLATLNVSELANGIYFVTVETTNSIFTEKLIIQK